MKESKMDIQEIKNLRSAIKNNMGGAIREYKSKSSSLESRMTSVINSYSEYGDVTSKAREIQRIAGKIKSDSATVDRECTNLTDILGKMAGLQQADDRDEKNLIRQDMKKIPVAKINDRSISSKAIGKTMPRPIGGSKSIAIQAEGAAIGESEPIVGDMQGNGEGSLVSAERKEEDKAYVEGGNLYENIDGKIYKNGVLVPESNYKYIPQEVGGKRETPGNGVSVKTYQEGKNVFEQIGSQIYKNGELVTEDDYKYVPSEIGGKRVEPGKGSYVAPSQTYVEEGNVYQRIGMNIYKNGTEVKEGDYKYIPMEVGGLRTEKGKGSFAEGFTEGGNTYVKIGDLVYKNGKQIDEKDYDYIPREVGGRREKAIEGGTYIIKDLNNIIKSYTPSVVRSSEDKAYIEAGNLYENIDGKILKNGRPIDKEDYKYIPTEIGGERVSQGRGMNVQAYKEGENVYERIGDKIYKNGQVIPEGSYKYVPTEIGGERVEPGQGSYVVPEQTYVEDGNVYQRIGGIIYKNGKEIPQANYKYIPKEIGGTREVDGKGNFTTGFKEGDNIYTREGDTIKKNGKEVSEENRPYVPPEIGGTRKEPATKGVSIMGDELEEQLEEQMEPEIEEAWNDSGDGTTGDYYRNQVVEEAKSWLGKIPYKYGGEDIQVLDHKNPPENMDCSAFAASVYKTEFGIELPRTTGDQIKQGIRVERKDLKVGDLVFFDWPDPQKDGKVDHVGIYIGDGKYIHEGGDKNVIISQLCSEAAGYMEARRIIQDNGTIVYNSKVHQLPPVNNNKPPVSSNKPPVDNSSQITSHTANSNVRDEELYAKGGLYKHEVNLVSYVKTIDNKKFGGELKSFKQIYEKNKARYQKIADKTGIPPEVIAALHYRESGCNFNTYLHNGQKLGKITTAEPKGKLFYTFEDAAIDALEDKAYLQKKYKITKDTEDIGKLMAYAESYNGTGYYNNGRVSPYIYSGTNVYKSGKYIADHKYDSSAVDKQPGIYILVQALK